MIRELKEYGERPLLAGEQATAPEYRVQSVPWLIELNSSGALVGFVRTSGGRGRTNTGISLAAPSLRRSGTNIKPQLLVDSAEFILGMPGEGGDERAARRHSDFKALVGACARYCDLPEMHAVIEFLDNPTHFSNCPEDLKPTDTMTFEVEEVRPIDSPEIQEFWATVAPRLGDRGLGPLSVGGILSWLEPEDRPAEMGQCLVCGQSRPIARVHPVAIRLPRPVADQQVALITANKEAFWSYGLEQSLVGPTCRTCAAAYAHGLNRLLTRERTHRVLADGVFICWTKQEIIFDALSSLMNPEQDFQQLFDALLRGDYEPEVDETRLYAGHLTASGGRLVIRDWINTTVGTAKSNLAKWFEGQTVVGSFGEKPKPLGLYALAYATVRRAQDLPKSTPRMLLASAINATPVPLGFENQVVLRCKADRRVTRQHAALLKLALKSRRTDLKEEHLVALSDTTNVGYRCGRLLAVLEQAQKLAIPRIRSTIVDRYFSTASSSPASVFPRLIRGVSPHLSKLRRDRPGAHFALQRRIEEIQSALPVTVAGSKERAWPRTLNLDDQGLFMLGYYHQQAFDREQALAARARQALNQVPEPDAELSDAHEFQPVDESESENS
jgi:CRISPR-associated protein Csd1